MAYSLARTDNMSKNTITTKRRRRSWVKRGLIWHGRVCPGEEVKSISVLRAIDIRATAVVPLNPNRGPSRRGESRRVACARIAAAPAPALLFFPARDFPRARKTPSRSEYTATVLTHRRRRPTRHWGQPRTLAGIVGGGSLHLHIHKRATLTSRPPPYRSATVSSTRPWTTPRFFPRLLTPAEGTLNFFF